MRVVTARLWLHLLVAASLGASACSDDKGDDNSTPDAGDVGLPVAADTGVHPDATTTRMDAGIRDALPPDSGPDYDFGRRLASVPADLIGISPDESEILYLRRTQNVERLFSISPNGGVARELVAAPVHLPRVTSESERLGILSTRPVLWMFTNFLRVIGQSGPIRTYRTGGMNSVITVTGTSAKDLLWVSDDGEWAIANDDFRVDMTGTTSTNTADLILVNAAGTQRHTIVPHANIGDWDRSSYEFVGPCEPNATFTSSTTAVLVACPFESTTPMLYTIDLTTGSSSTIAVDVTRYLQSNPEHTFFFWADRTGRIFASEPDGSNPIRFTDTSTVRTIRFLDHRRFVFNNVDDELKVTSYPGFVSTTLQSFGAQALRRVSPTGEHALFSQSDDFLSDLFMVSTATNPVEMFRGLETRGVSYPGDDAFTVDGELVFWYQDTNPNYIGDITVGRTDGTGGEQIVVRQAYWVFNYANPARVLLMINARASDRNNIICDVATRARDGSGELEALAGNAVCAPRDFIVFPTSRRIAYNVGEGPHSGIWVRDLP